MNLGLYGGIDPREMPVYTLREGAHHTGVPLARLKSWVKGRHYLTEHGPEFFEPILLTHPKTDSIALSFVNLVELHMLDAIRRRHNVSLPEVRKAIELLQERYSSSHPLADQDFLTDGIDLFVDRLGQIISVSTSGQITMREIVQVYLRRIEWDQSGVVLKLYPFVTRREPEQIALDEPRPIVINPFVAFGKPVLVGTGLPTRVIADRFNAGDSVELLASDYHQDRLHIEEAIRFERLAA